MRFFWAEYFDANKDNASISILSIFVVLLRMNVADFILFLGRVVDLSLTSEFLCAAKSDHGDLKSFLVIVFRQTMTTCESNHHLKAVKRGSCRASSKTKIKDRCSEK